MTFLLLLGVAATTFLALWATDDSNAQIGVPIVLAAGLFLPLPEGSALPYALGLVSGLIAYAIFFVRQRGQRVPMPDYAAAEGLSADTAAAASVQAGGSSVRRTPSTPDGPYYLPGTPRKDRLAREGTPGEPMRFEGTVRDPEGRPVEGAAVEIWHANGNGDYDNQDWNCRGHLYTDAEGRYRFQTVRPFGYGKRTWSMAGWVDYRSAHFHVKIRKDGKTFTTQIWFPGDERNRTDIAYSRFRKTNVLDLSREGASWIGRFDFVV